MRKEPTTLDELTTELELAVELSSLSDNNKQVVLGVIDLLDTYVPF